jgi:hypothetical protein
MLRNRSWVLAFVGLAACQGSPAGVTPRAGVTVVATTAEVGCDSSAPIQATRPVVGADGSAVLALACGAGAGATRATSTTANAAAHIVVTTDGARTFAPPANMPPTLSAAAVPAQADSLRTTSGLLLIASGGGAVYLQPGDPSLQTTPGTDPMPAPPETPTRGNHLFELGGAALDLVATLSPLDDGTGRASWTLGVTLLGTRGYASLDAGSAPVAPDETVGPIVLDPTTGTAAVATLGAGGALCLHQWARATVIADGSIAAMPAVCATLASAAVPGMPTPIGTPLLVRGPDRQVALLYAGGPAQGWLSKAASAVALVVDDAASATPSFTVVSLPPVDDPALVQSPPSLGVGDGSDRTLAEAGLVRYSAPGATGAPGWIALTRTGLVGINIDPACDGSAEEMAACTTPVSAFAWPMAVAGGGADRRTLLYATPAGLLARTVTVQ